MSFFDVPVSYGNETARGRAAWRGPADEVAGVVVPVDQVVFTSPHVAVVLREIVAQPDGCVLDIQGTPRRAGLGDRDWSALGGARAEGPQTADDASDPSRVMRFGVGLPDGSRATTLDESYEDSAEAPETPYLARWRHQRGVVTDTTTYGASRFQLWLWPLPPQAPFDLAVEWPGGGVPLSFAKLDGQAIHAAAQRARTLWS